MPFGRDGEGYAGAAGATIGRAAGSPPLHEPRDELRHRSGEGRRPHRAPDARRVWRARPHLVLRNVRVAWGANRQDDWSHALECHDVAPLTLEGFQGGAARESLADRRLE